MQKKPFEESENYLKNEKNSITHRLINVLQLKLRNVKYTEKYRESRLDFSTLLWSLAKETALTYLEFKAWKHYISKFPGSEVYFDRIYKNIKVEIGDNSSSAGPIHVFSPLHIYDYAITIGSHTHIGNNLEIIISKRHTPDCVSNDVNQLLNTVESRRLYHKNYKEEYGDISIGNDVWIGNDVTIVGGLKIGNGAIIGAKSFVNKNVKPYTIVAGIPCKKIRDRFTEEQALALERIKYWTLDSETISDNFDSFYDVDKFIDLFDRQK